MISAPPPSTSRLRDIVSVALAIAFFVIIIAAIAGNPNIKLLGKPPKPIIVVPKKSSNGTKAVVVSPTLPQQLIQNCPSRIMVPGVNICVTEGKAEVLSSSSGSYVVVNGTANVFQGCVKAVDGGIKWIQQGRGFVTVSGVFQVWPRC